MSFKMEAAIQRKEEANVQLLHAQALKAALKENPLPVEFSSTGLKNFQEGAFLSAYAGHVGELN